MRTDELEPVGRAPHPRASSSPSPSLPSSTNSPFHSQNYGGQVLHNYFGPGQFGYAISLSGVKNWTATGNTLLPHTRFGGSTHRFYPGTINAPPTAFVRQWTDRGRVLESEDVQAEFVDGEVQWLIGIEPEVGEKLEYEAGQVSLDVRGMSRAGEGGLAMKGARWEVSKAGELLLRKVDEKKVDQFGYGEYGTGRVIWTSGGGLKKHEHGGQDVDEPQLDFNLDGTLTLRSQSGKGDILWSPSSYLTPYLVNLPSAPEPRFPDHATKPDKWLSRPKFILQTSEPYLQLRDWQGNLIFSTAYEWSNQADWKLHQGQWIAIAPKSIRGASLSEADGEAYGVPTPPAPPSPGGGGPPPVPARPENQTQEHHHQHGDGVKGHFGRFVRDLGTTLQQHGVDVGSSFPNFTQPQSRNDAQATSPAPPPVPPRPDFSSSPSSSGNNDNNDSTAQTPIPTFLYLSPTTCQLILHSSPNGPTSPTPESTHWSTPVFEGASDPWVTFQGDGNTVLYTSKGVPWASGTNGQGYTAEKIRFKGHGEEGGPAVEFVDEEGKVILSSKQ